MSNRAKWAHWNKRKPEKRSTQRLLSFALLMIGGFLGFVGWEGIREHVLWTTRFSPRFGTFIVEPTSRLFLLSGFFILLSIYAWYARR